jgi:hypothetical protein
MQEEREKHVTSIQIMVIVLTFHFRNKCHIGHNGSGNWTCIRYKHNTSNRSLPWKEKG